MKRVHMYIIVFLLVVIYVTFSSFGNKEDISYSYSPAMICESFGLDYKPRITIIMNTSGGTYDGVTRSYTSNHITGSDLPTPTKSGYNFVGWYYNGKPLDIFVDPISFSYEGTNYHCYHPRSYSVNASWEVACSSIMYYPVYFQSNGGSSVPSSDHVAVGQAYRNGTLPRPAKSGFVFEGWYVNSNLTTAFNGSNFIYETYYESNGCPYKRAYLYAKWTSVPSCQSNVYNLYYQSNGGTSIAMETKAGSSVTFSFPTPTRSGYTFKGWYKDSGLTTKATNSPSGISFASQTISGCPVKVGTVYAKWEKVSSPQNPPQDPPEDDPVLPEDPIPPKPTKKPTPPSEETVKTCPNVINTLHISFNTDGGTELDELDICLTCDEEEITLPQPDKEGKNFVGWYADDTLENQVIVDGSNKEIQLTQFKLNILKNEDGCDEDVASTTLYARYEDATCKTPDLAYLDINFISGDETDRIEDIKKCLDCDEEYYELPVLKKDNYLFGGWYVDADYSRLVNKRISVDNAIKYLNVTRDFENGCSTDTLSTILYAKWIPLTDIKSVRIMFVSQGTIVDERLYQIDSSDIDPPELKVKGVKLLGWYEDSGYETELTDIKSLLNNSYGAEIINGQVFLYAYAQTEEVKSAISIKTIIICIIALAVIVTLFILAKRKKNNKYKYNNNQNQQNIGPGKKVTWHT